MIISNKIRQYKVKCFYCKKEFTFISKKRKPKNKLFCLDSCKKEQQKEWQKEWEEYQESLLPVENRFQIMDL